MGLQLQASIETLEYSETVHVRIGEAVNRDVPWPKMHAIRYFKFVSHPADKDVISQYVGEHFDPTGPSVLDIPLVVHFLISQGIKVFTTYRS
jgi:hypothetical protein